MNRSKHLATAWVCSLLLTPLAGCTSMSALLAPKSASFDGGVQAELIRQQHEARKDPGQPTHLCRRVERDSLAGLNGQADGYRRPEAFE